MASALALFLLPFSWLYAGIMAVRNWLYDAGRKKSEAFAVPLINVGNLRVGGTGKTPHVVWLVEELLRQGHSPAILSRGYGRQTHGPQVATSSDSATTVGDEPWQYFQQFTARQVPVAVAEQRRLGLQLLLEQHPETTVVVLDDAFQHRAVRPTLNVLLTDWARPFYHDQVLPAGRLRESRGGARRADVVIVTKCPPNLPLAAQAAVAQHVRRYSRPDAPVLFSSYEYSEPVALATENAAQYASSLHRMQDNESAKPAVLLTGVAQPGPLREYLLEQGFVIRHHAVFPDHYNFRPADLTRLRSHWQAGWPIFTTEKDATRLQAPLVRAAWAGLPFYTIPVRVAFLAEGSAALRHLLPPAPPAGS